MKLYIKHEQITETRKRANTNIYIYIQTHNVQKHAPHTRTLTQAHSHLTHAHSHTHMKMKRIDFLYPAAYLDFKYYSFYKNIITIQNKKYKKKIKFQFNYCKYICKQIC